MTETGTRINLRLELEDNSADIICCRVRVCMYVDCGACVSAVPRGVGGRDCSDTCLSVWRGRDGGVVFNVGVARNGSLDGVFGCVPVV
jgi:hypothetical protein